MVYHIAVTVLAMGLLLAGWISFQAWIRRKTPGMRGDADVLRGRFGSCGACFGFEDCRIPESASVSDADILEVHPVDEVAL